MEDYVLIDTVLQATHMSSFTPRPRHIKRYEIETTRSCMRKQPQPHKIYEEIKNDRFSHRDVSKGLTSADTKECITNRNKIKTKLILDDKEKLQQPKRETKIDEFTTEFFFKKAIGPKSTRENMTKSANLLRSLKTQKCLFYDINFDQVQKRQRNCIITP